MRCSSVQLVDDAVDRRHEPVEQVGQLITFVLVELGEDSSHRPTPTARCGGMPRPSGARDLDHHDPSVFRRRRTLGQSGGDEAVDRAGGTRGVDPQTTRKLAHLPIATYQQVEGVHLALLEWVIAEDVPTQRQRRCAAP